MPTIDELLHGIYSPTVVDVSVLVREVEVRIGVLPKPVTVRIYYNDRTDEPFRFTFSAHMRDGRSGDVLNEQRTAVSEVDALRRAVRMLSHDYDNAVRQGHMPDDGWFVEGDRGE